MTHLKRIRLRSAGGGPPDDPRLTFNQLIALLDPDRTLWRRVQDHEREFVRRAWQHPRRRCGPTELVRKTGLSQSTVYRLVDSLPRRYLRSIKGGKA